MTALGIVGNSKQLTAFFDEDKLLSPKPLFFFKGESGIGKGIFAKCIHNNSGRYSKSLLNLMAPYGRRSVEKALFGYGDENQGVIRQAEKELYISMP